MHSFMFHEKKQHGTVLFPAEYYYLDSTHPRYHMSFHWHKEWELIRVISGSFTAHIDEVEYTAVPGDVLLIRDSMLHGGTPADCVYECLVFDLHGLFRSSEIIKKHLRPIYRAQLLPHIHYHDEPTVLALVSAIMTSCAAKSTVQEELDHSELMFLGCICNLFAYLIKKGLYTESKEDLLQRSHRVQHRKASDGSVTVRKKNGFAPSGAFSFSRKGFPRRREAAEIKGFPPNCLDKPMKYGIIMR